MAINLQVENLSKSFGERLLFRDISLTIESGQRVGLIAANGSGKTTLLNIITGQEDYSQGTITFSRDIEVGYLAQDPQFPADITVLQAAFHGQSPVLQAIARYESALSSKDQATIAAANEDMDRLAAWDYEQRARQILTRLKITDLDQPMGELSGGQLKRVALAAALVSEPDLLILDEPTNHLDFDMVEWLEEFLTRSKMSLLMVTHDRYFLDRVCNEIIEIDNQQIYKYKGNYSYYIEKRAERQELEVVNAEKTRNLYRRELDWIRRTPSARSGKAKYRIDAFEETAAKKRYVADQQNVQLGIKSSYIGTKIFEVKNLDKRFGDKMILENFSYLFSRYEKLGIVGDNGVGKSTFLKMLLGQEPIDGGVIDIGQTVRFGYYSQAGLIFDQGQKVIDVVKAISEDIALADGSRLSASQFLQKFLFSPSSQYDFVSRLSGGERRRLYLCTILMSNPNFLVLDEPTNDLDIPTLNVLEEYLASYGGCVIVVSHDRYFMDKIVDHLLVMQGEGVVRDFPGSYTAYREQKLKEAALVELQKVELQKVAKPLLGSKPEKVVERGKSTKLSFAERREYESLEGEIAEYEAEKCVLQEQMSSGSMSSDSLLAAANRIAELIAMIDEKSMRWLEFS
ncbi:MAG: ABC-F family ATP-binding cassette domain-containing protein, partial [Mucinivorans sp.]